MYIYISYMPAAIFRNTMCTSARATSIILGAWQDFSPGARRLICISS